MTKGPALVAPYLPQSISGQSERIEGEVVRKQREGNRLLVRWRRPRGQCLSRSLMSSALAAGSTRRVRRSKNVVEGVNG